MILDQLGGAAAQAVVRVFRMVAGKPAYLDRMQLTPELYDSVKAEHGGGEYYAAVVGADGKIITQFYFSVAGAPKQSSPAPTAPVAEVAPSRMEQLLEKVLLRLETPPAVAAPTRDPIAEFKSMAELFSSMQRSEKKESALEQIDILLSIQERLGGIGGPRADDNGFLVMAREFGKPALELISRSLNHDRAPVQAPPVRPALAAPVASLPAAAAPAQLTDHIPVNADPIIKLVGTIPVEARRYLAGLAEKHADPYAAADRILALLDDDQYAALAEQIERPDFTDVFTSAVPRFQAQAEWFAELVAAIRASMPDEDASAAESAGGDASPAGGSTVAPVEGAA